jgi:hypothetical protein
MFGAPAAQDSGSILGVKIAVFTMNFFMDLTSKHAKYCVFEFSDWAGWV